MRLRKIIPFTVLILSALLAQVFAVALSQPQSNSYSQPSKKATKPIITKVSQTLASKDNVLSDEAKSQNSEKLNPAPQSGTELIFKIGEEQIIFLQDFLKLSARDFSMDDLQKFRGVINAAVEDHPEVLAAVAARRSAGFSVREAKAAYYPQVNAQTQRGPVKSDPSTTLGTAARNYQAASVGLVVRQLLFDFGGTNNAIDASNARDELSQYKTRLTRSDVALRAVQAHHEMLRATRQLDLANRNFQSRQSILELVSQRQGLGGGTVSDVVRAQSRVADAAASVVATMQKIGLVEASYRELFGPSKSQDSSVLSILVDIPLDKALLEEVKLSSSDSYKVKMAIATRNAAEFDMKSLVGKNLPSISVEVSNTRRDLVGPGEPGFDRSIYFVAKQNLYTGGADTAREQQYREKFLQSEEDLRAAKREAQRVYDQALLEANSVESLVKSRLRAVELSAESLRMVREQFAYRRGSLLDLLTAQEALNTAGRDLIDAQIDSAQTKYKVLSAAALLNKFFALSNANMISQLNATYVPLEDRVLFKLNTVDSNEFRLWLTRNMVQEIMNLCGAAAVKFEELKHPAAQAKSIAEFKQQAVEQTTTFSQYKPAAVCPLGEDPILVNKLQMRIEGGQYVLIFGLVIGKDLTLRLNDDLLAKTRLLLNTIQEKARWMLISNASPQLTNQQSTQSEPSQITGAEATKLLH